jgi:hypothetical protein
MSIQLTDCKIYRTSDQSEIISMLKQNPLKICFSLGILIGSRAARHFLPNFRGIPEDNNADWNIIISSKVLLKWLRTEFEDVNTINMIVPLSNDEDQLDLYIYCTLHDGSQYNFVIPQSSISYTAYILNNPRKWIKYDSSWEKWGKMTNLCCIASVKLLLILKKYMLYYSHQWEKTAKDYRELLTVSESLTRDDMVLCNLFVRYNEKVHGSRPFNSNEFVINSTNTREGIIINRHEFFQSTHDKQISFIYQVAMSLSFDNDILIGLEHICTQGPRWLADYIIKNWIDIHQEKFKYNFQISRPSIHFETENYRLFPDIPEIATKRILHFITDTADFYSMQFVCKQWYTILHEEIFWRDLYTSRYGAYSGEVDDISSWKMLYLVRMEGKLAIDNNKFDQLVDATIELRQYTATDILRLWEDLTHRNQSVDTVLLTKINYILSNSFYYQIKKTSNKYSVRLVIIGLEHECSPSKVSLNVRVREYGSSRFTDNMEQLSIQFQSDTNEQRSLKFLGPTLFGFDISDWGYISTGNTYFGQTSSTISDQFPSGLLICLFIMMVHPDHRAQFIMYLKNLESHCLRSISSKRGDIEKF